MVIDTSAIIAILRMEPEAELFLRTIAAQETLLMSSVSALEAAMVLAKGLDETVAWQPLDEFIAASRIEIVAFDAEQSRLAREAFAKFGKGCHKAGLNLGDCTAMRWRCPGECHCCSRNDFGLDRMTMGLADP